MNTADLTLYLGGTRSGKSERAEARVLRLADGPVLYVATAQAGDEAMAERIRRHRARRPAQWRTLECPLHLGERLSAALDELAAEGTANGNADAPAAPGLRATGKPSVLVDCVTLWVSNILFSLPDPEDLAAFEREVRGQIEAFLRFARVSGCRCVLVSGETGLGGINPTPLGRVYADGLGLANRLLADAAEEAFLVIAGRVLRLEREEKPLSTQPSAL